MVSSGRIGLPQGAGGLAQQIRIVDGERKQQDFTAAVIR